MSFPNGLSLWPPAPLPVLAGPFQEAWQGPVSLHRGREQPHPREQRLHPALHLKTQHHRRRSPSCCQTSELLGSACWPMRKLVCGPRATYAPGGTQRRSAVPPAYSDGHPTWMQRMKSLQTIRAIQRGLCGSITAHAETHSAAAEPGPWSEHCRTAGCCHCGGGAPRSLF